MSQRQGIDDEQSENQSQQPMNRRSLLKTGMLAGSAVAMASAGLLATTPSLSAQESGRGEPLTRGDVAILRFLAAAELIESDLWNQYAELAESQMVRRTTINWHSNILMETAPSTSQATPSMKIRTQTFLTNTWR
jgi:hypothetical protein